MPTAIEQVQAIQQRLDKTKSDPIWINEALAALQETLGAEANDSNATLAEIRETMAGLREGVKDNPNWLETVLVSFRDTMREFQTARGLNLNLEGFAGIGFTDMAACAALTGLIERWEDEAVFHMGDIDSEAASASMKRLAMWATTTGEFMAYEKRRRKAAAEAAAVAAQAQAEDDAPDQSSSA